MSTRRDFLGILGAGAVMPSMPAPFPSNHDLRPLDDKYDMSWVDRVRGTPHKVVIDSPEVSEGGALYRSVMLRDQYRDVFGTFPDQFGSVLVIRHSAIDLAMDHSYWERFPVGEEHELKDRDGNWVKRNPVGPAAADARPGSARYTIPGFIADGGIVLACDLAFGFVVAKYRTEGVSREAAREEALKHLIPGVILQPSGFFAVVRAQQAGCALFCNG
ncbi:MAG TPA: hypothetical protein PLL69_03435 [Gemmatimonadales bacterium]|nr:hypothetical protein [Gemmatimonadales bacterium]